MLGLGSGTIWRCGLVGVGVSPWVYKNLILAAWKPVFCWQPSDEDVGLSAPPAPCLPGCCHVLSLMILDWTSEPVNQPQLNVVLIRVASVVVSVHSSKNLTKSLCTGQEIKKLERNKNQSNLLTLIKESIFLLCIDSKVFWSGMGTQELLILGRTVGNTLFNF